MVSTHTAGGSGSGGGSESGITGASRSADESARRSTVELIQQASDQFSRLLRGELELAKLELSEKAKKYGAGIGLFAFAAVLIFYVVGVLLAAAVLAFSLLVPGWAAALIVAGIMLVLVAVLALIGYLLVKRASPPAPREAIAGIKADMDAIKESARR